MKDKILESLEKGILLTPDLEEAFPSEKEEENEQKRGPPRVKVLSSYAKRSHKRTYEDYISYFNQRFKTLSGMLRKRQELINTTALARLPKGTRTNVAIIGLVSEKQITKNGNVMLLLEDQTGTARVIITQKNKELLNQAKDIVHDEVIGVTGQLNDNIIFGQSIIHPDIPIINELKKGESEEYIAVIGDPEIGGKDFLKKDFEQMIAWLNGEVGSEEQRSIAAKVNYLVLVGDLVAGVGVYPNQEADLEIKDIQEQYSELTSYLEGIPKRIEIIIIPGNHDAGRLAEPQPPIYKDFAPKLYEMENVTMLSNPSWIVVGASKDFPGFTILLYHGYSLIYYSDNVPSIRARGGQKRAELIMKYLLQRRHLAPTHGSNLYIPDPEQDPLIINPVPDLFITGHIHRVVSATYRGVSMINASAWSDISEAQERRGLEPQPSRLPLINLRTREVRIINFYTGRGSVKE